MEKRRTEKEIKDSSSLVYFVKEKRKKLGMTQEQFALRVGVSISFLKRLETGDTNLQYAKLLHVVSYLGAEMIPREVNYE